MPFPARDREICRALGSRLHEISQLPYQAERKAMWTKLNRLEDVRPMCWMNEWPTHELGEVDPELQLECEDEFARALEWDLRFKLYRWDHLRLDDVVDPYWVCPYVIHDTGYGIERQFTKSDAEGITSVDYTPVLQDMEDVQKIQLPTVTPDWEGTDRKAQMMDELLGDSIPVLQRGIVTIWGSFWDQLIQWYGITELMMDMVDRPEFVHACIGRMRDCFMHRLDQYEEHGLISLSEGNHRVGSGGLGITDELPDPDDKEPPYTARDIWGNAVGQIFSEVSPTMHDEFCLQYELPWLERFGLNCYGCCEPLDTKMGILKQAPRLRRVSMSTWINKARAVEAVGRDYVFSCKPNPAIFATDSYDDREARRQLKEWLDATRGLHVEIIMKDISTCKKDPQRLWQWCDTLMEMVQDYA